MVGDQDPSQNQHRGYWLRASVAVSSRSVGKGVLLWKKLLIQTLCVGVLFLGCWVTETLSLVLMSCSLLDPDAVPGVAQQRAVLFQR